jgi:dTMP kinase
MGKNKGFLITFESTSEGLGKTVQSKRLADNLRAAGYDVILTKHFGGTKVGKICEEVLKNPENRLSKATELFLVMADRAQTYTEVIKPALKAGRIVVCDRFVDSTLVYQGYARGWKAATLWRLHQLAAGAVLPDLTLVLDGTPFRMLSAEDRFEIQGDDFFSKMKAGMLHLARKGGRYELLNANEADETAMADRILRVTQERLAVAGLPKPLTLHS